jgi:hypothetical protein
MAFARAIALEEDVCHIPCCSEADHGYSLKPVPQLHQTWQASKDTRVAVFDPPLLNALTAKEEREAKPNAGATTDLRFQLEQRYLVQSTVSSANPVHTAAPRLCNSSRRGVMEYFPNPWRARRKCL